MSFAGWIVVISMDGKYRDSDIDVLVLVVDMVESAVAVSVCIGLIQCFNECSPSELLACITQHLDLTRLVAIAVLSQTAHDLVHRLA